MKEQYTIRKTIVQAIEKIFQPSKLHVWKHIVFASVIFIADPTIAQTLEEDDLDLAYGDKTSVSIATGTQQSLARAPAVATVITAQEIQAMGATDLDQVLESVPGMHVSISSLYQQPIYSVRGISSAYNPQVLMLVNGLPITNVYTGNRSLLWGGMPLENVSRIEVIRGPGSALYGAEAYAGVINVITKTASDINGTETGVRLGSYHGRDAWIQHGGKMGAIDAAFYLRAGKTDGQNSMIEQDAQSAIDRAIGTSASLAPGRVNAYRAAVDARADLSYENWRFRAAYQERNVGLGAGLAESLDPDVRVGENRIYLDLTYQNAHWAPDWDLTAVVGYYNIEEKQADPAFVLFPVGAFGGAFPNGVIGNPGHSERHEHASVSTLYSGLDRHRIRLGTGARTDDLYSAREAKNYTVVTVPGVGATFIPWPSVVDVTGNTATAYMQPHKRHVMYAFAQDEWSLAKDWTLTAGVRHDAYSDFGGTTNPRVALVWDAAYNVVIKAMHGRAFRAPSFVEQYNVNNAVATGNPRLRPETIVTNELAASWHLTPTLQTNLSLFRYHMHDVIRFVPNADPSTGSTAQNTLGQTGRGAELEVTWDVHSNLRLSGSYSLQHSIDEATGKDAGLAPHRRIYARADWRFAPLWQLGTTVNYVAERKRQPGDTRPDISDYTTVDLAVRREKIAGNWELRGVLTNLFNRDAREPSLAPGNILYDLPLPGRAFYIQLQNNF